MEGLTCDESCPLSPCIGIWLREKPQFSPQSSAAFPLLSGGILNPPKTGRRTGDDPPPLRRSEVKPQTELHVARSVAGAIDSAEGARRGDAQCRTTHDGVV